MRTKKPSRTETILHPQRLRIIRALANGSQTPLDLLARLGDIPQATLYRHLGMLLDAGTIEVVAERPVRGVIERSYALVTGNAVLSGSDLTDATAEDHFRYFSIFVAGLLGEYSRYLERDHIDPAADGVGYREVVLNLNDEEFLAMVSDLRAVIQPLLANKPDKNRSARLLATVLMPGDATNKGDTTK